MRIFKYYINHSYFFDIVLIFTLFFVLYNIHLPYWEIPDYWPWIISISSLLIFTNSEKIQRLKKSNQFKKVTTQFLLYVFLYFSSSYLLSINIHSNILFNFIISLWIIVLMRIFVYTLILLSLYINSKIK